MPVAAVHGQTVPAGPRLDHRGRVRRADLVGHAEDAAGPERAGDAVAPEADGLHGQVRLGLSLSEVRSVLI